MVRGNEVIIYYNSKESRWVTSVLIHEVTHLGLSIECRDVLSSLVNEAPAYVTTFKLGFKDLHLKGIK